MKLRQETINRLHQILFGETFDSMLRSWVLKLSVVGFAGHLFLWALVSLGYLVVDDARDSLVASPLAALYTPFSILLAYEMYELVRAIPSSFSVAVGKQFEVVTLLIVRDIFKKLSLIDLSTVEVFSPELGIIFAECGTFLFLYYTALSFQRYGTGPKIKSLGDENVESFVVFKKTVALGLFFIYAVIAAMSVLSWLFMVSLGEIGTSREIFFFDYFTFIIIADILILLISHYLLHDFVHLARNTGFVLSTVVLRVAIGTESPAAIALFVLGGMSGLGILWIAKHFTSQAA